MIDDDAGDDVDAEVDIDVGVEAHARLWSLCFTHLSTRFAETHVVRTVWKHTAAGCGDWCDACIN